MSRKCITDKFELYGESHFLIKPSNFDELMKAMQVKDDIQTAINGLMNDEDSSKWGDLLQTQEHYIHEYVISLGEFDNTFLVNNINYIVKNNGLHIGELEKLLGISAGYISRTAKENSAKKLSIDVVWKIAKLFETDFRVLLETDLRIPNSNTEMAAKFLQKIYKQTAEGAIEWISNCGFYELDEIKLVTEEDAVTLYHPMHLNPDARFILTDDIFICENIVIGKEILIIPFTLEKSRKNNFDFVLRWLEDDERYPGKYCFKNMFNTCDDPRGPLDAFASSLYRLIRDREFDTSIAPDVKGMITEYLK